MKIVTIVGARPQFIKAAMVSKELRINHQEILIHTGQHYDKNMSDVFFEEMNIPKPDYNLNIGSGTHAYQTGNMMIEIEKILMNEKPDYVLVYGDTNSTLAGALAASKLLIPIIHVEAGLRSFNMEMPEEQNRILTDHLSNVLFCPSSVAIKNLKDENITNNVFNVGDVMCDSTLYYSKLAEEKINLDNIELNYLNGKKNFNSWYLLTIHRAENTKDKKAVEEILKVMETLDSIVIYPIHPRIKDMLYELDQKNNYKNILFVEPVDYMTMLYLVKNSKKIITDSGGLQKECYILDKPCITVRDQTEWVETLEKGYNVLSKPEFNELKEKIANAIIKDNNKNNFLGDGQAAKAIITILEELK